MPIKLTKKSRKFKGLYVVLTYLSDRNSKDCPKIGQYSPPNTKDLDLIK